MQVKAWQMQLPLSCPPLCWWWQAASCPGSHFITCLCIASNPIVHLFTCLLLWYFSYSRATSKDIPSLKFTPNEKSAWACKELFRPTYSAKVWRNTPAWARLQQKFQRKFRFSRDSAKYFAVSRDSAKVSAKNIIQLKRKILLSARVQQIYSWLKESTIGDKSVKWILLAFTAGRVAILNTTTADHAGLSPKMGRGVFETNGFQPFFRFYRTVQKNVQMGRGCSLRLSKVSQCWAIGVSFATTFGHLHRILVLNSHKVTQACSQWHNLVMNQLKGVVLNYTSYLLLASSRAVYIFLERRRDILVMFFINRCQGSVLNAY